MLMSDAVVYYEYYSLPPLILLLPQCSFHLPLASLPPAHPELLYMSHEMKKLDNTDNKTDSKGLTFFM